MSEVCILHAADSESFARKVAAQLAAEGYSVLRRDAQSPKGAERRLGDAVIVVWSEAMLAAAAMIDAARRALARRILVPIAIGDVAPPASFAHLTPIDLNDWGGDVEDPRWQFVREEVDLARRRGEGAREAALAAEARPAPKKRLRAPLKAALLVAGAGAAGVAAAVAAIALDFAPWPDRAARPAAGAPVLAPAPRSDPAPLREIDAPLLEVPPPPIFAQLEVVDEAAPGDAADGATAVADAEAVEPDEATSPPVEFEQAVAAPDVAVPLEPASAAPLEAPPLRAELLPQPVADAFAGAVFRDCADCPDMAEIPSGLPGGDVAQAFAMSRREIRFSDWEACVADGGCGGYRPADEGWGRNARPVINVSHADAERYVRWLSEKTGRRYRLPTAQEWAYAAQNPPARANVAGALDPAQAGLRMSVPAGSFEPSVLGLYDMRGNAAEWTSGCTQTGCIVAGGAFDAPADAPSRAVAPAERSPSIGFRVARDLP